MIGMDAATGKSLDGTAHLRQSITDILTTPLGSRVMRRDYGSDLFSLVDAPLNNSGVMDVYEAVVTALNRWEPRVAIANVQFIAEIGALKLTLNGSVKSSGTRFQFDDIMIAAS